MIKDTQERKWKVLKSEYLFKRPWLTARRDHVQLPTGAEIPEYYILEYPDWVNTIAITTKGEYVMIRQYRHGIQETRYELCAGVVETGEEPMVAARRELLEETGYGKGEWSKLMTISANSSTMTNLTHCFVAVGVEKVDAPHTETSEDITVHLLKEQEIKELLKNDEIRQALMAAPLWKYFAMQQKE